MYEHRAGLTLDDRLLADAAGADTLPLLQFTLQQLFKSRDGTTLTFVAYEAMGGLDGAINQAAEGALTAVDGVAAELPRLLRQLVAPVRGASAAPGRPALTIRSVPLEQAAASGRAQALVDALVEARVLLLDTESGVSTVRLAHQRAIESWARAREIAKSNDDFYRIRGEVEEQQRRWAESGRRSELLLAAACRWPRRRSLMRTTARSSTVTHVPSSWRRDEERVCASG